MTVDVSTHNIRWANTEAKKNPFQIEIRLKRLPCTRIFDLRENTPRALKFACVYYICIYKIYKNRNAFYQPSALIAVFVVVVIFAQKPKQKKNPLNT